MTPKAPTPSPKVTETTTARDGRVAFYTTTEQARIAVKLLVNSGFSAEQITVLCSDETNAEKFRSRLLPAGGPQLNTATSVVAAAGASMGAGLLGAATLVAGWPVAVAVAGLGGVAGGAIGAMIGAATESDDRTKRLLEAYDEQIRRGRIVVLVAAGDDDGPARMQRAHQLLVQAASPM